jgi:hypothetical protein
MRQLFTPLPSLMWAGLLRAALTRRPTYAAADLTLFSIDIRL